MRNTNLNLIIDNLLKADIVLLKNNLNTEYLDKIVNVDYLITSLKQFIVVTKRYFKTDNKGIIIITKNKTQKFFIDKCLFKLKLTSNIETVTNLSDLTNKNKSKLIIVIDSAVEPILEKFIKASMVQKNYFIFNVNADLNKNNFGIYSVLSQMNNIKKILFLLVLIKRIIK